MSDADPARATRPAYRVPLLALGMLSLLTGMWAGLLRLGWVLPVPTAGLAAVHGPLMVCGFLGTLIGLERAVGLGARWAYTVPLLAGAGGLAFLAGASELVGRSLVTAGSAGLVGVFGVLVSRVLTRAMVTMGVGAACWLVGNALWLVRGLIPAVVFWWIGFLVLTIAGERLELGRVLEPPASSQTLFTATAVLLLVGMVTVPLDGDVGVRIVGAGLLAVAAWLLSYDVARRTIREPGLPRFIAVGLLLGYGWLVVGGVLAVALGLRGFGYDAVLHAVFVGFVFSMIFAHAPIVFPSILARPIAFRPVFYVHLGLLHATVGLRVLADVTGWLPGRRWGGLGNVLAVALFLVATVSSLLLGPRARGEATP